MDVAPAPASDVSRETRPAGETKPGDGAPPSLLGEFDAEQKAKAEGEKKPTEPEAKPAEAAKPEGEAKPDAEAKAPEASAVEPVAYDYKLPDGFTVDDATKTALHSALDQFRADPAAGVQALMDLHVKAMNDYQAAYDSAVLERQHKVFNDTQANWRTQVLADPEIGGSGHNTAMQAIARARDLLISSAKPGTPQYEQDRADHEAFMAATGAGNHPVYLKLLNRAAKFLDEPQARDLPQDIRPSPSNGRAPGGRKAMLYENTNFKR